VTLVVDGVVLNFSLSSLQVGQYVMYQNMTEMWSCVVPVLSQNASEYVEGVQFPACAYFQYVITPRVNGFGVVTLTLSLSVTVPLIGMTGPTSRRLGPVIASPSPQITRTVSTARTATVSAGP
jgi:hypothetical protein